LKSWHWQKTLQVNWTFNPAVGLTFDVRGGPPAGRPLDGGVRPDQGPHDAFSLGAVAAVWGAGFSRGARSDSQ